MNGWAIDFDNESETNGCTAGFETEEDAREALRFMQSEGGHDLGVNACVRRCRHATIDDFGLTLDLDHVVESWDEDGLQPSGANLDVFGRWDDQMLEVRGRGRRLVEDALRIAIEVQAWVLYDEPSEEDRSEAAWADGYDSQAARAFRGEVTPSSPTSEKCQVCAHELEEVGTTTEGNVGRSVLWCGGCGSMRIGITTRCPDSIPFIFWPQTKERGRAGIRSLVAFGPEDAEHCETEDDCDGNTD